MDALAYGEKVRELCLRVFTPDKKLKDGTVNPDYSPAMVSEAVSGAACMVAVARIFKALETGHPSFIPIIITDLSFGLAENQFWKQHGQTLVPVFKNALHAYFSAIALEADKATSSEKREIAEIQKRQWHSLFFVAYDCLYGISNAILAAPGFIQELVLIL